ncbi:MAG: RsfS/YbeB/iojap family protein [Deltaproteobacteria bacterium]|nr:RsfS/YbeB/iojap family protein [Deltaproteobacteria bacterium]
MFIKDILLDSKDLVLQCVNAALDRKAEDLVILKVKDVSSFADYFVICSGNSDGERSGSWILMDYGDVIIHVFYKPVREFYDIEGLWSDAPRMTIEESVQKLTVLNDDM